MNKSQQMPNQGEITVLVHGIWMQGFMMAVMAKRLKALGFLTVTFSYDFLTNTPAENAQDLYRRIGELGAKRVNLVGHSLGGIIILNLLSQYPTLEIGKIVLLGSPVKGSHIARRVHQNRVLRPLLGRSAGTGGLLRGAPDYESKTPLGIITGSGRMGILALLYSAGTDSDGVVRGSESFLDNATDRICLPYSHSSMIFSKKCAEHVANFLKRSRFGS